MKTTLTSAFQPSYEATGQRLDEAGPDEILHGSTGRNSGTVRGRAEITSLNRVPAMDRERT
ncbi:hypothetical protein ACONUD_19035 [Microbulbifer harenosus]|uniref:Uncharacterized protein n=1 Tax=Microbulbifer harenosus TaxID=2576840 RepID=A0ABY2UFX2_9GAMM|nr:hypothetical protein [Microbulbifer harenosus]TLM75227.1 hypothetical protein FDY93_16155 [Microbulbifer harenosus]